MRNVRELFESLELVNNVVVEGEFDKLIDSLSEEELEEYLDLYEVCVMDEEELRDEIEERRIKRESSE